MTTETNNLVEQFSPEEAAIIGEMVDAGVLHGRKHSCINPKMGRYILSTRRGVDIFDIQQTWQLLNKALDFLKATMEKGLPILVVGAKPASRGLVESFARRFNFPFVTERWLGGTLTNFKTIFKRVDYFKKLRSEKEAGALEKYTKKERLIIDRRLEKMKRFFGGVENLNQLPAVLIVVDVNEHGTAVREANKLHIPVVGLVNTDGNPDQIKYVIPCNDNARMSISWILGKISDGLSKVVINKEQDKEKNVS